VRDLVDDRLDYRLRRFTLELQSSPQPAVSAADGTEGVAEPTATTTTVLLQDNGQSVERVMEKCVCRLPAPAYR
jgi:hypothetical protein